MKITERVTMNCKACQATLPDLLLDPVSAGAAHARIHIASCPACLNEFNALQATFQLLDSWEAPEPSPWFDSRLQRKLAEAQAAAPEGWLERLKSHLLFSTGRQLRPALAGALALALAVGGGTAVSLSGALRPHHDSISATVQDLQILDRNEQAFQAMDDLQDDGPAEDGTPDAPTS